MAPGINPLTAAQEQDLQLQRRLQQDSILLAGKTIYINPFLYWRRFDSNTDRWLREPGQLSEEQIASNRSRFYPELDWTGLDDHQIAVYDGAVEMFLKSLDLISTFHPELGAGQMLEVERKMTITKKRAMIVVGKDGFIDWAWSSEPLIKSGIFYAARQSVIELP